jgi:excisionase family DNA binding protein
LFREDDDLAQIMTTKEMAEYLKLHEITICKYAGEGRIPAIRIGRVWRFDKDVIDEWIAKGQSNPEEVKETETAQKVPQKRPGKKTPKKRKR